MSIIDTTMRVVHVLFAGAWTGGTLLMATVVLPAAQNGRLGASALEWILDRFTYVTLASVGLLFVTGGHLAGTGYTFEALFGTGRGHLVLGMLGLWFVLAGILHVGTRGIQKELDGGNVETAVDAGLTWYRLGGVVAALLLVVAGLL
jgi:uncharacterized membrane protein